MKVSVLVITYNHEQFIAQAIDSILMQQVEFDYEIVIGEDCSKDNTRAILSGYQARHPGKIKLILPEKNIGMMKNFTQTLRSCQGDYIALCEGDDYWTSPLKLKKQVDFLEANPNYSLVFCNVNVIYQNDSCKSHLGYSEQIKPAENGYLQVIKKPKQTTSLNDLVYGNYIHTPGVLFRNWTVVDEIPKYIEKVSIGDWPLHLYSAKKGNLFYMDEVLTAYRVHAQGAWSQKTRFQQLKLSILQYPPLLNSKLFEKKVEQQLKKNTLSSFRMLLSQQDSKGEFRDVLNIAIQIITAWKIFPLHLFANIVNSKISAVRCRMTDLSQRIRESARRFQL
jgi:glycosyltransferase involved in cell wall biosynthesis